MRMLKPMIGLALTVFLLAGFSAELGATSRAVMLEDLRLGNVERDLHHRPERPGKVVRVVPWVGADGAYSVLAVTEVGWVYQATGDAGEWMLVGRIFDSPPFDR